MHNDELSELDASLQAIVRRAYDLGRSEALKRVVEVLSTERPSDQLALMAPPEDPAAAPPETEPDHQERSSKAPWWAWPVK